MTTDKIKETITQIIRDKVLAERARCATICYVKAYEINAMGSDLKPGEAAAACAKAIEQQDAP